MSIIDNVIFSTTEECCGSCLKSQKKSQTLSQMRPLREGIPVNLQETTFVSCSLCFQKWKSPCLIPKHVLFAISLIFQEERSECTTTNPLTTASCSILSLVKEEESGRTERLHTLQEQRVALSAQHKAHAWCFPLTAFIATNTFF